MKYINTLSFVALCILTLTNVSNLSASCGGSALYSLDLADPTNNTRTCGTVSGKKWQVAKNNNCSLTTKVIPLPGDSTIDPLLDVPVSFRVHATGNCGLADSAWFQYSVNGSIWNNFFTLSGDTMTGVTYFYDTIKNIAPESNIQVRVVYDATKSCTNWKLWNDDGDGICIGYPYVAGTNGTMSFLTTTLPVELVKFEGTVGSNQIMLDWATATEKNNEYFTLEKSDNGASFDIVDYVEGAGNSSTLTEYKLPDNYPNAGHNYYRLSQTDIDDNSETFEIINIDYAASSSDAKCSFNVYPNPCIGGCNVDLETCDKGEGELNVNLIDAMGNVVRSNVPLNNNSRSFSLDRSNNLAPGVYIISGATKDDQNFNKKIIVQ